MEAWTRLTSVCPASAPLLGNVEPPTILRETKSSGDFEVMFKRVGYVVSLRCDGQTTLDALLKKHGITCKGNEQTDEIVVSEVEHHLREDTALWHPFLRRWPPACYHLFSIHSCLHL